MDTSKRTKELPMTLPEPSRRVQAPSTRIRIFFNTQLFLSGIHSSTQGSSALKCLQSMRRRARQWREICSVRPPRCACRTRFLRHRIKKYPDSPVHTLSDSLRIYFFPLWPRPHVIGFVAHVFSSTLESGFIFFRIRCRIRRIRVDGSRIWKEKVADSKTSGYVWTGPQSQFIYLQEQFNQSGGRKK